MFKGFEDRLFRVQRSPSPVLEFGFDKSSETSQYSDSMFAVALTGGTEFVQDGGFSFTRGLLYNVKRLLLHILFLTVDS